jgi:glucose dehydrogenase
VLAHNRRYPHFLASWGKLYHAPHARSIAQHPLMTVVAGKLTLLKLLSVAAGFFLLIAGLLGAGLIFFGGGLIYFVACLYTVFFGCLVLAIEVKDRHKLTAVAYQAIEVYLKFLTLQRGKGIFYVGVGLLVFFIAPAGNEKDWFHWGVINVAALVLIAVGILHTMRFASEATTTLGPGGLPAEVTSAACGFDAPMPGMTSTKTTMSPRGGAKGGTWSSMVAEAAVEKEKTNRVGLGLAS